MSYVANWVTASSSYTQEVNIQKDAKPSHSKTIIHNPIRNLEGPA